jgi:hypothetical protein
LLIIIRLLKLSHLMFEFAKPCSEMFCLRNQDITDAKAFFYLFFMSNSG